jgi:uncharacterized membrane protein
LRGSTHQSIASAALILLIALCLAWELAIAPLRPGGSWLALKCLPLLAPLMGILRGRRYTYQWASMLVWLYVAEGATRAFTDSGASRVCAIVELALGMVLFVAITGYVKATRPALTRQSAPSENQ